MTSQERTFLDAVAVFAAELVIKYATRYPRLEQRDYLLRKVEGHIRDAAAEVEVEAHKERRALRVVR